MNNASKYRLLWVDDQIHSLRTFVEAVELHGFQVSLATSTEEAVEQAQKTDFDICLVDIRMPPPDGIECLRQLNHLRPNAKLASLSSYHYLEKYRQQLRALDFSVQLMDKDFPDALSPDFETQFIAPVRELARTGVTVTIRDQDKMLAKASVADPFEIPLVKFNTLPLLVKDQIRLHARKQAAMVINKAFGEGKIWVLHGQPLPRESVSHIKQRGGERNQGQHG